MNAQVQTQIPIVKLAKVGQKRKKRNFIPFLPQFLGGGSTRWSTAAGLSMGAKMAIVFLVSTLGVGAYQVGRSLKPGSIGQSSGGLGHLLFAAKPNSNSENIPGLPTEHAGFQNSLGLADAVKGFFGFGSNNAASDNGAAAGSGATAAGASATGSGAAAGASPFDALAKAKDAAEAAKAKSGPDGGLGSGLDNGGLGSGMGSASSGAGGSGLAGGSSGLSGAGQSMGANLNNSVQPAGKVTPLEQSYSGARLAASGLGGEQGLGAGSQLRNIASQGTYMKGANPQMAEAAASNGFDSGQAGGSAITGSGITGGNANTPPPSSDNPSGGNDGGPTNGGYGGGYGSAPPGTTTPVATPTAGTNAAPWAGLVNNAGLFLEIAMVLLFVAAFLGTTVWGRAIAVWVGGIAALLAGFATLLGMMMMGMGQMQQGLLITVLGGITTAAAALVALDSHAAKTAQQQAAWQNESFLQRFESEFGGELSGAGTPPVGGTAPVAPGPK